jgi:Tfp pilus assembly protein PilF
MSLIHQVLKDLDGQREVTPGEIIGYADHEDNHRVMIWPALVISIFAAVFVLYFSQYFESDPSVINRSSLPVIPVTGKNPAVVPLIAEVSSPAEMPISDTGRNTQQMQQPETITLAIAPEPEVAGNSAFLEEVAAQEQSARAAVVKPAEAGSEAPASIPEALVVDEPEAAAVKAPTKEVLTTEVSIAKDTNAASASVTRRLDPENFYIRAVTYYRNGDWQRALSQLDEAIKLGFAIEYPALQARIYLEQGMRDEFIAVSEKYASNQSRTWLSTVAPGLHMFGQYQAAAEHYSRLIQQEPRNAQWAIARTQAQIDAGATAAAQQSLEFLTENYPLSKPQQDWVKYQQGLLE